MTKTKRSYSVRGIPFSKLFDWKTANLSTTLVGLFYLVFPWFSMGVLDTTTAIFGIMFISIAIMRAKPSNRVISGFFQAFIALCYLSAVAGLMDLSILWIITLVLTGLFFVFELGFLKFTPQTTKADAFQIVPLMILGFALLMGFAGYASIFVISFTNMFEWLNYAAMMLFCFVSAFQVAGWNVTGKEKSTNTLILFLGIAIVFTALLGTYQGTLFAWS